MADLIAFVILIFTLILPIIASSLRSDSKILIGYWIVIILHHSIAFTNTYVSTILGADADAVSFYQNALSLSKNGDFYFGIGAPLYENMLGIIFWIFGPSHFLAHQLSILAFSFSCIIFIKFISFFNQRSLRYILLIAFGALPSMIFFGSIVLRESLQLLFFMSTAYCALNVILNIKIRKYIAYFILSAVLMGLLHHALLVYSVFVILMVMSIAYLKNNSGNDKAFITTSIILVVTMLTIGISFIVNNEIYGKQALASIYNMDVFDSLEKFREKTEKTRATYGQELDRSTIVTTIYSAVVIYIYYLFYPLPWQVGNIYDVYAATESFLRIVLIVFSFYHWRIAKNDQKYIIGILLLMYTSMTFMWAMGTTNYGTAMRHHMLTWWILILLGVPALLLKMRRIFSRKKHAVI